MGAIPFHKPSHDEAAVFPMSGMLEVRLRVRVRVRVSE